MYLAKPVRRQKVDKRTHGRLAVSSDKTARIEVHTVSGQRRGIRLYLPNTQLHRFVEIRRIRLHGYFLKERTILHFTLADLKFASISKMHEQQEPHTAQGPSPFPTSVIVIGAGIFGLSTALAIAKRHSSTTVTVIDRLTPPVIDGTSVDTTRCIRAGRSLGVG